MRLRYWLLSVFVCPLLFYALLDFGYAKQTEDAAYAMLLRHDFITSVDQKFFWGVGGVCLAFFVATASLIPGSIRHSIQFWSSAIFTAVLGVLFLFALQFIAPRIGYWWTPTTQAGQFIYGLIQLMNASYGLVDYPSGDFATHLFGYTFGVGLAEEMVKLLPVFILMGSGGIKGPTSAAVVGLASGLGFGLSEGILYSYRQYVPSEAPLLLYLVRFITCTVGHGLLTASAAIIVQRWGIGRNRFEMSDLYKALFVAFPSMLLHAFYNTYSVHGHGLLAVSMQVATFCWFAFQYEFSLSRIRRSMKIGDQSKPSGYDFHTNKPVFKNKGILEYAYSE
jgi:RsiW-degrading membrane proteinase PrsW (M82 family)